MIEIYFDVCQHLHTICDIGHEHLQGKSQRYPVTSAECYALEDGKPCHRRGRCIIARNNSTWEQVNSKTFINKH